MSAKEIKVYLDIDIYKAIDEGLVDRTFVRKSDHDTAIQDLKADLERMVKMYAPKIKRNCQHDDPSWCNEHCNDFGNLAREIGDKNGIKYE